MEATGVNASSDVSQNKNVFDTRKIVEGFQSMEKLYLIVREKGKFKWNGKHESLIKLIIG